MTIIHSKGGRSADSSPEGNFEFVWELRLEFERNMSSLQHVSLTIPYVNYNDEFPNHKRKGESSRDTVYRVEIKKICDSWVVEDNPPKPKNPATPPERPLRKSFSSPVTPVISDIIGPRVETAGEKRTIRRRDSLRLGFIVDILGNNSQPLFAQWGTATVANKVKERLLVVSHYRVLLIKRTKMGKKKVKHER